MPRDKLRWIYFKALRIELAQIFSTGPSSRIGLAMFFQQFGLSQNIILCGVTLIKMRIIISNPGIHIVRVTNFNLSPKTLGLVECVSEFVSSEGHAYFQSKGLNSSQPGYSAILEGTWSSTSF